MDTSTTDTDTVTDVDADRRCIGGGVCRHPRGAPHCGHLDRDVRACQWWDDRGAILPSHQWGGAVYRGLPGHEDLVPPSDEHGTEEWTAVGGGRRIVTVIEALGRGLVCLRVEKPETYAIVDDDDVVVEVIIDARDPGDGSLRTEMAERCLTTGASLRWVYVDGSVSVGDEVDVDDDGVATYVHAHGCVGVKR